MDKFKCQVTNLSKDFTSNQAIITLKADASMLPILEQILNVDMNCTLTKYKGDKARSLNANAYMWVLLTKLQNELQKNDPQITKDELYMNYIKDYGRSVEYIIQNEAINAMISVWSAYGLGWFAEKVDEAGDNASIIRFYYGSSCYNVKRMKRLIDAVVTDCKALGIETRTPDEIAEMLARWGEQQ